MNGNCMMGCKHCLTRDIRERREVKDDNGNVVMIFNDHVGYEHYCEKDPKAYADWMKRNKDNTYAVYKNDCIECYEPIDIVRDLRSMNELAQEILDTIKK